MKSATEESIQKANKQLLAAIRKLPQQPLIVAGVLAGFAFFGTFFLLSSRAEAPGTETAYFAMEGAPQSEPFIIALTDPSKIAKARTFATDRGIITGTVVKERAAYNNDWSYHLDPTTIDFVEQSAESCDATPRYIEDRLAEVGAAVLPDNRWCPSVVTGLREVAK